MKFLLQLPRALVIVDDFDLLRSVNHESVRLSGTQIGVVEAKLVGLIETSHDQVLVLEE